MSKVWFVVGALVAVVVTAVLVRHNWQSGDAVTVTDPPALIGTWWEVTPDNTKAKLFDLYIESYNPSTHQIFVTMQPNAMQDLDKVNGTYVGLHLQFRLSNGTLFSADLTTTTQMRGSLSDGSGGVVTFTAQRTRLP